MRRDEEKAKKIAKGKTKENKILQSGKHKKV
jgi:hypothetical protein